VVTTRSYIVRRILDRGEQGVLVPEFRRDCGCNFRDDTSDVIFRGWSGETAHPNWVSAVEATHGQVIGGQGVVALGLSSASSGGYTENYADVYGTNDHPYLISVDDHAAFTTSADNPHASWTASYSQSKLAATFGFSWVSGVEVVERNVSGSARTVRLIGIVDGHPARRDVDAIEVRSLLSLWSTGFSITTKPRFIDVPTHHPFAGEILAMDDLGVTRGCLESHYCPEESVTRAEMAAFLTRALGLSVTTGVEPFADDDGHALESDIETIYRHGITNGCGPSAFCPNRPVTRAEMAAFLIRALAL
jgi:SpoIID/LytB domain protein